nr:invasion associated locus B family protein [Rhizobium sp. Q54]
MSLAKGVDATTMLYQAALPLGIAVQKPVSVSMDSGFQSAIRVSRCTPQGCLLEGSADSDFIGAMKAGAEATFSVSTPEGQTIPIALSLKGFSEALAALPQD